MMSTSLGTTLDWLRLATDCLSALRLMLSPAWWAVMSSETISVQHRMVISDWGALGGAAGAPMVEFCWWSGGGEGECRLRGRD